MRSIKYVAAAMLCLAMVGCSKSRMEKMAMVKDVVIESTPEVLELVGEKVPATISVTYPKGYFHPKACMKVTPVIVYEGGEAVHPAFTFQGEKVKDNYKVVPSNGGTLKEKVSFDFVDGMQKSYLELRSVITFKGKSYEVPAIKVADGVRTTCQLVDRNGAFEFRPDGYQEIIKGTSESQIMYDVNSSTVKNSKKNKLAIDNIKEELKDIKANERMTVTGTEIVAYASPEGGENYNAKLSDKRASSSEKAFAAASKEAGVKTDVKSVGQDWEGFQTAVSKSDIEDKDLILRVLSMYSDPNVRENEIRNMSQIFTELKKEVLPELRRARFIASTEYKNYTAEELEDFMQKNRLNFLDETAVLRLATNSEDPETKINLYKYAYQQYGSQTALYNLAMTYFAQGQTEVGKVYLEKLEGQSADIINAKGIAAMKSGKYDEAARFFEQAGTPEAKANLGTLDIITGDFASAAKKLAGTGSCNEALAYILNGQPEKATPVLMKLEGPKVDYLKAVIAARKGDATGARKALAAASKCDCLKERAVKDIEFANVK